MHALRWAAERQPGRRACDRCKASPDKQVLPGHDTCLPPIGGRHTADGYLVCAGLRVWDYDLRPGTVAEADYSFQGTPDGPLGIVAWHLVRGDNGRSGMFDGTRMWTRHPVDGTLPPSFSQVLMEEEDHELPGQEHRAARCLHAPCSMYAAASVVCRARTQEPQRQAGTAFAVADRELPQSRAHHADLIFPGRGKP